MDTKKFEHLIWADGAGKEFIIDEIRPKEDGMWVFYHNTATKEEYSCLLDSFTKLFTYREPSR